MPPTSGADAATAALLARAIPFTFVFNVRDLGCLSTVDGRTVQPGRLYRADGVNRLSGDDLDAARALGLRTVIDLRTKGEVDRGRFPIDEIHVTWHHLPMIRRMWSEDDLVANDGDAASFLRDRYLDMLDEGAESIRQIVELVADGTPALFHCAAGKDRTGVVAAILLSLVGVEPDEIAHDYHLSAHTMAAFMDWLREHHPDAVDAMSSQPKEYMAAPAEAMEAFLTEVDNRYGSMHGLADHLGIQAKTIKSLSTALLD
ncbi:MAG: tyrosine-protein phosphatase [Actinomycetota bacterium]|nr:tyrosine-protein phosphatase [Actinomycetota bacterium]